MDGRLTTWEQLRMYENWVTRKAFGHKRSVINITAENCAIVEVYNPNSSTFYVNMIRYRMMACTLHMCRIDGKGNCIETVFKTSERKLTFGDTTCRSEDQTMCRCLETACNCGLSLCSCFINYPHTWATNFWQQQLTTTEMQFSDYLTQRPILHFPALHYTNSQGGCQITAIVYSSD
jgi:hypothetical protein